MSIFKKQKDNSPESPIPVTTIDLSKRYDVYCGFSGEDRLYEDVRLVGIRTFDNLTKWSSALVWGYIEIEARDGTQVMIPKHHIQILCEHGHHPSFKVLKRS